MVDDLHVLADVCDRNERIIDQQVEGIRLSTDRGIQLLRFILIYAGLLITALSILLQGGEASLPATQQASIVVVGVGGLALTLSLAFSIRLVLGGRMDFGTAVELEDPDDYATFDWDHLTVVRRNRVVLESKARQFRFALSALIAGLVGSAAGMVFLLLSVDLVLQAAFGTGLALAVVLVSDRIISGDFEEVSDFDG